jgi:sugar phosphate permease
LKSVKAKSLFIFALLAALLSFSMFYRVSNAVIARNLVKDLRLSTETLGILGGAFFYSFALLQVPMGILLDRIGPRMVMSGFAIIGASGALIFSASHSLTTALIGRILLGAGMASMLMGSMKVFVLRFSPQQFATLSGALVSLGTLGSLLASSPLAYLTMTIGWRHTFLYAGMITAILGCLAFWILKDGQSQTKAAFSSPEQGRNLSLSKLRKLVLGNLSFWQIGAFSFFRYGTFVTLQGLWLGPYLMEVKGFSPVQAGNLLMTLSIGFIAGAPISGYLLDRVFHSTKLTTLCGVSVYALLLIPLTGAADIESPVLFSMLFLIIGFFNSFGTFAFAHVKQLFPLEISGTVIAGINFFSMAGAATLMPLLGKVIQLFTPPDRANSPEAFHLAFLVCFLGMTGSILFYAFSKDGKR